MTPLSSSGFRWLWGSTLATATARRRDPRYNMPFLFQNPREVRLGVKLMF